MIFAHRFLVAFGWILAGFWETQNFHFSIFFEAKSKTKKHYVLEGLWKPPRRGKKQSPEPLREWEGDRGETFLGQVACRGGVGGVLSKISKGTKLVIQVANALAMNRSGPDLSTNT